MIINIAKDYSNVPGGRFEQEGPDSGEKFRETVLHPKWVEAVEKSEKLTINFDGGYGYATSFLEEAFGGLVRQTKKRGTLDIIELVSQDDMGLVKKVNEYVRDAESKL